MHIAIFHSWLIVYCYFTCLKAREINYNYNKLENICLVQTSTNYMYTLYLYFVFKNYRYFDQVFSEPPIQLPLIIRRNVKLTKFS